MSDVERPQAVFIGVYLAAASVLLGLFKAMFVPVPGPIWLAVVIVAVILALVFAVWRRHNWARIVLLILFLLGLPGLFLMRDVLMQQGAFSGLILLAQTLAQAIALYYFFSRRANAWFRRSAAVASPESSAPQ